MPRESWNKRHCLKLLTRLTGSIGTVGVIVGSFFYSDPNSAQYDPNDYTMYEIWAVAVAPLCVCLFVWVIVAMNEWWRQVTIATTPLPNPAEIYRHLEIQYERPATMEEVAAAQQMLVHRRNEALVNAGIGLGALYAIHRRVE